MITPLSDLPIVTVGGFFAVVVSNWKTVLSDHVVSFMGRPLRPESQDLWILTTTSEDAMMLAKLVQRNFFPEEIAAPRSRDLTANRQPTFREALPLVPQDVACYMSATHRVDDQAILQQLHPAPARTNERISWTRKGYEISSTHGRFRQTVTHAPRGFPAALAKARADLLEEVGPGFDTGLTHLNGSPMLAAALNRLAMPAAEAAAYWLSRLGTAEIDVMVIPGDAIATDIPVKSLHLESKGVNLHASFWMNCGDVRISEMEAQGLDLPDTAGVALDAMARRGELRLSQIIDLPGAETVPVLSLSRGQGERGWTARLDPVAVPLDLPSTVEPFRSGDIATRFTDAGYVVRDDAAMILSSLGRERTEFILHCVEDGQSGMHFDISAWTPGHVRARILLRDRAFILESDGVRSPVSFLAALS